MAQRPHVILPHASVNKDYAQAPQWLTPLKHPVLVVDIEIAPATGLAFNYDNAMLTGVPTQAGEFKATVYYYEVIHGERSPIKALDVTLLINPDPRSLWKNIPSSPDILYAKADAASQQLKSNSHTVLAASQRGRSHAHKGLARDDDFFIAMENGWQIAILADGAGSAQYSRHGAYLACQAAGAFLQRELADEYGEIISQAAQSQTSSELTVLCQTLLINALARAVQAIEAEALTQPDSHGRDFATTLLVAVVKPAIAHGQDLYVSYSVGDGVIALYQPQQSIDILSVGDSGEFAGQTRFLAFDALTEAEAATRCQTRLLAPGHTLLLMSDGVSDPFFDTEQQLKKLANWDNLWRELQQQHALSSEHQLLQWLDFWSAGHHDDRTIVIVLGGNHA